MTMEYWEFLIQKEGERSWQPVKSPKIDLEAGRYRVVAHTSRTNIEVDVCVSHQSTGEVPPKRRFQKRSRRTNPEGLMVVIPFTELKPGLWELRCCGDILSDFLGNSWQHTVQLRVVRTATEQRPERAAPLTPEKAKSLRLESEPPLLPPAKSLAEAEEVETGQSAVPMLDGSALHAHSHSDIPSSQTREEVEDVEEEVTPINATEYPLDSEAEPSIPETSLASATSDDSQAVPSQSAAETAPTHPVWEQSLETLEQILQQVLEPILQEFNDPESGEVQLSDTSEPEPVEIEAIASGLGLALEEEALVARHGEALHVRGRVVIGDVEQFKESEIAATEDAPFQGSLRYELRDPQSSQVLLNTQYPLPEQPLPLTFDHTLEIPSDCNSRLLLGTIVLYSSTSVILASQPFSVTLDLDELLGAIIPGSKAMPLAKAIAVADRVTNAPDLEEDLPLAAPPSLDGSLLDLVNTSGQKKSQPFTWQPSSGQSLPPQIYRPSPTRDTAKSLQLPQLPKLQSTAKPVEVARESETPQEETESLQLDTLATSSPPETEPARPAEEIEQVADSLTVEDSEEETDERPIAVADTLESEVTLERETLLQGEETDERPIAVADTLESEVTPERETLLQGEETGVMVEETPPSEPLESPEQSQPSDSETAAEPNEVEFAFQALNLQDRFWSRLNSLAVDREFSEWLEAEVSPSHAFADSEVAFADTEESVRESEGELDPAEFDESMWQETDDLFETTEDSPPLELPQLPEDEIEPSSGLGVASEWDDREIVVEDEELTVTREQAEVGGGVTREQDTTKPTETSAAPEMASLLELESPLPTPTLIIPVSELIAGNPVTIRVKLAPHPARLGVKLWLQDRQSRSLLDGPRWLMDLLPNRAGELETLTQVTVPFGSTEIRIEAIAVDIQTQRESQKIAIDRVVLPPDLPNISLEEFEI
jgi:hypothetical protein